MEGGGRGGMHMDGTVEPDGTKAATMSRGSKHLRVPARWRSKRRGRIFDTATTTGTRPTPPLLSREGVDIFVLGSGER